MLTKVLLFLVNLIRIRMLRRADRKAARVTTEWLRRSPDRMLDDIGISRIALFADLRPVPYDKAFGGEAGRLLSRQGQITPLGDIQIDVRPGCRSMMRRIVATRAGGAVKEARMPPGRRQARLASPDGRAANEPDMPSRLQHRRSQNGPAARSGLITKLPSRAGLRQPACENLLTDFPKFKPHKR